MYGGKDINLSVALFVFVVVVSPSVLFWYSMSRAVCGLNFGKLWLDVKYTLSSFTWMYGLASALSTCPFQLCNHKSCFPTMRVGICIVGEAYSCKVIQFIFPVFSSWIGNKDKLVRIKCCFPCRSVILTNFVPRYCTTFGSGLLLFACILPGGTIHWFLCRALRIFLRLRHQLEICPA